jgi:hypothetical protein
MQKVTLSYDGPGEVTNLDVAAETGDGRLEPGREITVSQELAELLERSTPYWTRAAAKSKPAASEEAKN